MGKYRKGEKSRVVVDFLVAVLSRQELTKVSAAEYTQGGKCDRRAYYKMAGEILGCSVKRAIQAWNAMEYKFKVLPRHDLVMKLGFGNRGRISIGKVGAIIRQEGLLRQAMQDGQLNILPILLHYNETPEQLKKRLGKGLWKSLCKNTFSRNKIIMRKFATDVVYGPDYSQPEHLALINKMNTTLIKNHLDVDWFDSELEKQHTVFKIVREALPMKSIYNGTLRDTLYTYLDTQRMFEQNGINRNAFKIPYDEIDDVHDQMVEEVNAKKYSKDKITWLQELPEETKYLKLGQWEVVLLDTKYDIWDEGNSMKHCVASYGEYVANKDYLVYSIRKDGKRVSTLGVNVNKRHGYPHNIVEYRYSQHYEFSNKPLKSSLQALLADVIIDKLNRLLVEDLTGKKPKSEALTTARQLEAIEEALKAFDSQWEYPTEKLKNLPWNPYAQDKYHSLYDSRFKNQKGFNIEAEEQPAWVL